MTLYFLYNFAKNTFLFYTNNYIHFYSCSPYSFLNQHECRSVESSELPFNKARSQALLIWSIINTFTRCCNGRFRYLRLLTLVEDFFMLYIEYYIFVFFFYFPQSFLALYSSLVSPSPMYYDLLSLTYTSFSATVNDRQAGEGKMHKLHGST